MHLNTKWQTNMAKVNIIILMKSVDCDVRLSYVWVHTLHKDQNPNKSKPLEDPKWWPADLVWDDKGYLQPIWKVVVTHDVIQVQFLQISELITCVFAYVCLTQLMFSA
jgi:hypothetical protein